jgi:protein-L-isoaspartate(D-aspartate) O-methyltransferase
MEYKMNIEQARFNMVEQQIRPWNVLDLSVLELLSTVKREAFVPAAFKDLAFADIELPLGHGQCMLAPRLEARLLQDLGVQPHENVLEIGTGSGYMTALLAHRALKVTSLELSSDLVNTARTNLRNAGVQNVEVKQADGALLTEADGSFDVIVLSGSVTEVPQALLQMLKVGGRLAAVVGNEPVMCATFITRTSTTDFRTTQPWDCDAPRLQNFPEPSKFQF